MKRAFLLTFLLTNIYLHLFSQSINDHLICQYPMDSLCLDTSGNAHHATIIKANLTTDRFGNPQSAFDFDGDSSFIEFGSFIRVDTLKEATIAAWFYPRTNTSSNIQVTGIQVGEAEWGEFSLTYSHYPNFEPQFNAELSNWKRTSYSFMSSQSFPLNKWYHVVGVYKENEVLLFIDGVLNKGGNGATSSPTIDGIVGNPSLIMGKSQYDILSGRTYYYNGKIDDVRIYGRALEPWEIDSLHDGKITTSIKESAHDEDRYDVYPNPFNGHLFIRNENPNQLAVSVSILDFQGVLIDQKIINPQQLLLEWEISNLSKGHYLIVFKQQGKIIQKKKLLVIE
ncbi:T9SS type A sorting domain-containing protein [bacterium SCSIO 12741]|nr:T9SS type A sorting domain-containing protein [bacterium SCSIO 12741]